MLESFHQASEDSKVTQRLGGDKLPYQTEENVTL